MSFLKNCSFEERESISNIESEDGTSQIAREETKEIDDSLLEVELEVDDSLLNTQEETNDSHLSTQGNKQEHPPNKAARKKITKTENTSAASKLMEFIISKNEAPKPTPDPVDTFLASIGDTLKTLSPYHLHLAKGEIFNIVQKYEYQTIFEQGNVEYTFVASNNDPDE